MDEVTLWVLRVERPKKKKKKRKGKMTGASQEDKASIREEFLVTLKLNIQKKWNAASVFLGC